MNWRKKDTPGINDYEQNRYETERTYVKRDIVEDYNEWNGGLIKVITCAFIINFIFIVVAIILVAIILNSNDIFIIKEDIPFYLLIDRWQYANNITNALYWIMFIFSFFNSCLFGFTFSICRRMKAIFGKKFRKRLEAVGIDD